MRLSTRLSRPYPQQTRLRLQPPPVPGGPTSPPPANEAASDAARAVAEIVEVSWAVRVRVVALMPVAPSPSMYALTLVAISLVVLAPAPLRAPPNAPPPAIAAEPASTLASMVW